MEENQYLYSEIKKEGIELFNSGQYDFASFKHLSAALRRESVEADFEEWYGVAKQSIMGVEDTIGHGFLGKASFEFQQCVEMCYTAIEMVFSHYNPHEHNLFALRDRNVRHHKRLKGVFHYDNEEHTKLFDQLNYAYIGGRYRNEKEFPVDIWIRLNFGSRKQKPF